MVMERFARSRFVNHHTFSPAFLFIALIMAPLTVFGQQNIPHTLPGLEPGSPAGSYLLDNFSTVNLYNGNLNTVLPLARVGGRGDASVSLGLPFECRWNTAHNPPLPGSVEETLYPRGKCWRDCYR
jgi:hypothetical protein